MNRRGHGFTLLELLVSMGLLTALGLLVLRLLTGGIDLWSRGEEVRDLLVRSTSVADLICQDLEGLAGTGEGEVAAGRLVDAPFKVRGLESGPLRGVRFLRPLHPWEEGGRLQGAAGQARPASGALPQSAEPARPEAPAEVPAEAPAEAPARPEVGERAALILFPFVSRHEAEAPGTYLSLRRGEARGSGVGPTHPWFGPEPFPGVADLLRQTEEVFDGLLYFDLRYWSQATRSWEGGPGEGGPERAWDSTRGGATLASAGSSFSFDLGPWSLEQPFDDLVPRLILLELVVDRPPREARCALLAEPLDEQDSGPARVEFPERLGQDDGPGFFKAGAEWIRYRERKGEFVHGLDRGVRGSRPAVHKAGERLHVGWTVRRMIQPRQPREWWGPTAAEPEEVRR